MIIIRAVFSLAVLALVGVLVVALSGQLWARYQKETVALGFSGVYERLALQVSLGGGTNADQAFVEAEQAPPPAVREAAAEE